MEELNQRNLNYDWKLASHAVPWTWRLPSLAKTLGLCKSEIEGLTYNEQ